MNDRILSIISTTLALMTGNATGCISTQPVRGWIPPVKPGEPAPDFSFVDQAGRRRAFSELLGDYTVVIFSRCDRDTHVPAAKTLEEILDETRGASHVKVVGVDIHWSQEDCRGNDACHVVEQRRDLVSLCDAGGAARRLYGADDSANLFVIGPDATIVDSGSLADADSTWAKLQAGVNRLSERRTEELEPG
jgi:peroxiredoxin